MKVFPIQSSTVVTSGSIVTGGLYINKGTQDVIYNAQTFSTGFYFTGLAGITTFAHTGTGTQRVERVQSSNISFERKYIVVGGTSIDYNGSTINAGNIFTGIKDVYFFTAVGGSEVYEYPELNDISIELIQNYTDLPTFPNKTDLKDISIEVIQDDDVVFPEKTKIQDISIEFEKPKSFGFVSKKRHFKTATNLTLNRNIDINIYAGQSNAQTWASASAIDSSLLGFRNNIQIFNPNYSNASLGFFDRFKTETVTNLVSGGIFLGDQLANYSSKTTHFTSLAEGGTGLFPGSSTRTWGKAAGHMYKELIEFNVKPALIYLQKKGYNPRIKAMFWMQGEQDATNTTYANAYEANLTQFIADVRADLGLPNLPFVFGRIHNSLPSGSFPTAAKNAVRLAQDNVAANVANTYKVNTDSFALKGDNVHFEGPGILSLETAYFNIAKDF